MRAATEDRCSECGLKVDRSAMAESGFPWPHRAKIGRMRAFVKTVWRVTIGTKSIRHDASKEQLLRDARVFSRWNAAAIYLGLLFFAGTIVAPDGPATFAPDFRFFSSPQRSIFSPAIDMDGSIPWAAGVTFRPLLVIPLCLLGLAAYLAGATRAIMRLPADATQAQQDRAECIGFYAAAPLSLLSIVGTRL